MLRWWGIHKMALTKITADVLTDSTIVVADLAATGTPTSSTALQGNDVWAALATSGVINFAAADPGTGQTTGNAWFLSGLLNFVTTQSGVGFVWASGTVQNTGMGGSMAGGSLGSCVAGMGSTGPAPAYTYNEQFDGVAWSTAGRGVVAGPYEGQMSGASASAALQVGGTT